MKSKLIPVLCCLLITSVFTACKKTMDLPELSNTKITEYKVPVSDGTISGVIDESDKTITVYLPFYYQLDVIDPQITVSTGAKLSTAAAPVDVMSETTTYTVNGTNNSSSTYTLKIEIQQLGPLAVIEPSTATTTAGWAIGAKTISIQGNFNTTDPTKIKVFLVGSDQVEHALIVSGQTSTVTPVILATGKTYTLSNIQIPQNLADGNYKVRVKVLRLTGETTNPIKLIYGRPVIDYKVITVKQGDTFTISTTGEVFYNFQELSIIVGGQKTLLPIVSFTRTEATISVPENIPVGTYAPTVLFQGWAASTLNWPINVTAK